MSTYRMEQGRLEAITALRALAFIAIFISHCDVIATGAMGASFFILCSGFCMTYAYYGKASGMKTGIVENIRFSVGKIRKLYPLHLLTFAVVASVVWFFNVHDNIFIEAISLPLNLLLLQSWIPVNNAYFSYNAVAWYLSVAAFLYFMFPWILSLLNKRKFGGGGS